MKLKKVQIFFNPIDGSAPLFIDWYDGNKGDAVESLEGNGVGFFGHDDELLGVIFDDVSFATDNQDLVFANSAQVGINVKKGKVTITKLNRPNHNKKAS